MNGRVIFDGQKINNYELFENQKNYGNFNSSLNGIQDNSILSRAFFSQRNINCIQKKIQDDVLKKTNYKIGRQSDLQLQIIMRSIYLQYSKNLNCNYAAQIKELNKLVSDYSIDRVVVEIYQFLEYRKEVSKLPQPLTHPVNLSNKGEKTYTYFQGI